MKTIIIDKKENIATITLNRPDRLNALNPELLKELLTTIKQLEKQKTIKTIIITGTGKAFSAGADIKHMQRLTPTQATTFTKLINKTIDTLENLKTPTIAAINGYCLGGGNELALACDIRIASDKSYFGQPEVTIGITPGAGASQRLPNLIGIGKAKELILTGKIIPAKEALQIGLINQLVPARKLINTAEQTATIIAENAPQAVRTAKKLINLTRDKKHHKQEQKEFIKTFKTKDRLEGMTAFIKRRHPKFKGN